MAATFIVLLHNLADGKIVDRDRAIVSEADGPSNVSGGHQLRTTGLHVKQQTSHRSDLAQIYNPYIMNVIHL